MYGVIYGSVIGNLEFYDPFLFTQRNCFIEMLKFLFHNRNTVQ